MELLAVIHHPGTPIRAASEIAAQLATTYDAVMDAPSVAHTVELPHTLVVLLTWRPEQLGWEPWHVDEARTLATVGLPALLCPPETQSQMLTPARLATLVRGHGHLPHDELAFAGGYFVAALADTDASRVRLITNYAGDVALYRAAHDGITVWSNRAPVAALLAGLPAKLNVTAARQTLLLWHPLGDADIWDGVSVEPAAMCIDLDAAGIEQRRYIKSPRDYFTHRCTDENAIVERTIRDLKPLAEALADQPDAARMHLTGGHDSRCAAAILRHHGYRPRSVTLNAPNSDAPIAQRVAAALGLQHAEVRGRLQDGNGFLDDARRVTWLGGGCMSLKYLAGCDHLSYPRDEGYTPMTGIGGETGRAVYFDGDDAIVQVSEGDYQRLHYKVMYRRADHWPQPDDVKDIHGQVERFLAGARDAGLDAYQVATWYWLDQKVRRWESHRRTCGYVWPIDPLRMPCWTYAAAASPPKIQVNNHLIDRMTAYAWPAAAKVPTVAQAAEQRRTRRIFGNRLTRTGLALLDRLRPTRDFTDEHVQSRALSALRQPMLQLLRDAEAQLSRVVDVRAVESWVQSDKPSYYEADLLWSAMGLAMWCREFAMQTATLRPAALSEKVSSR